MNSFNDITFQIFAARQKRNQKNDSHSLKTCRFPMKRKVMITLNMTTSLRNDDLESWTKANVQKKNIYKRKTITATSCPPAPPSRRHSTGSTQRRRRQHRTGANKAKSVARVTASRLLTFRADYTLTFSKLWPTFFNYFQLLLSSSCYRGRNIDIHFIRKIKKKKTPAKT